MKDSDIIYTGCNQSAITNNLCALLPECIKSLVEITSFSPFAYFFLVDVLNVLESYMLCNESEPNFDFFSGYEGMRSFMSRELTLHSCGLSFCVSIIPATTSTCLAFLARCLLYKPGLSTCLLEWVMICIHVSHQNGRLG